MPKLKLPDLLDFGPVWCRPRDLAWFEEKCLARAYILGTRAWVFVTHSLKKTFYHQRSQTQVLIRAEHITK